MRRKGDFRLDVIGFQDGLILSEPDRNSCAVMVEEFVQKLNAIIH